MRTLRLPVNRASIVAFILLATGVACAGTHAAPAGQEMLPQRVVRAAGGASLSITTTINAPALNVTGLTLYAYPLTASGPLVTPLASAQVLSANVAAKSSSCTTSGNARVCSFTAQISNGNDAVVALLSVGKQQVARALTAVNASGSASLALVTGKTAVGSLAVVAPTTVAKGPFSVGVTLVAPNGATVLVPLKTSVGVRIYGPPGVVPSPQATINATGGTAPFTASGTSFVNPMTVVALAGQFTNTAQIFPSANTPMACAPLTNTKVFPVPEPSVPSGFSLRASVAGSKAITVSLDSGSTTFAISQSKLTGYQKAQLIGPGQPAQQTYYPSGTTIKGNYYLAPVNIYAPFQDGGNFIARTVPMEVLITTQVCPKGGPCQPDNGTAYMGIGYGRPTSGPGWMSSPLESAIMQLQGIVQGNIHPGFMMTADSLTIGINSSVAASFPMPMQTLSPYPGRLGDWSGPSACMSFNGGAFQCGSMLLDIGIASMFISAATPSPVTSIQIVSPQQNTPQLNYTFAYPVVPGATPPAPNPNGSQPIVWEAPRTPTFVNTGRDALAAANYLYDAGCGQVGFATP